MAAISASLSTDTIQAGQVNSGLSEAAIGEFKGIYLASTKYDVVDVSDDAKFSAIGITITASLAADKSITWAVNGDILDTGAASLTKGDAYYFDSSGDIVPYADLSSGDRLVQAGRAISDRLFKVVIDVSDATK